MTKNNSGFTMIELLAAVVVLGILMGIAIPAIIGLLNNQRGETYIKDSLRLVSNMENKLRSDNKMIVPARGACVAMNLTYLDNNTFEIGPYGGEYDRWASFVVARRNTRDEDEEYTYYVRLVEKMSSGGYRGVDLKESNLLYNSDARTRYVSNLGETAAYSLTDYEGRESSFKNTIKNSYSITCSSVVIYAPEDY